MFNMFNQLCTQHSVCMILAPDKLLATFALKGLFTPFLPLTVLMCKRIPPPAQLQRLYSEAREQGSLETRLARNEAG